MAKDKMIYFRTAIGGFNKSDVNSYIERANSDFAEREKDSRRTVETLKVRIDTAEKKIAELSKLKDTVAAEQAKSDALTAELSRCEAIIAAQKEQIEQQKEQIDALDADNKNAQSEAQALGEHLASLSEAIEKSQRYDDVTAQVGDLIISAKATAEEIVERANKEAARQKLQKDKEISETVLEIDTRAKAAAYSIKKTLGELAEDTYSSIYAKVNQTQMNITTLLSHIQSVNDDLDALANKLRPESEIKIKEEISDIYPNEMRAKLLGENKKEK